MDYSQLGQLSAIFHKVPIYALTATATEHDRQTIISSLCMRNVKFVIGDLDRPNIFLEKVFREHQTEDALDNILSHIINGLKEKRIDYPITVIYLQLKWCGYAYWLFENMLGKNNTFPMGLIPFLETVCLPNIMHLRHRR